MLQMQASDEEVNDVNLRCPFILWSRRLSPANNVVFYMYASDTGHTDGSDTGPKGRSVSFPTQEPWLHL